MINRLNGLFSLLSVMVLHIITLTAGDVKAIPVLLTAYSYYIVYSKFGVFSPVFIVRKFIDSDNRPKPVRCVETGVEYRSAHFAEKVTGLVGVRKACLGIQTLCGGYHWQYT